MRCIGIDPGSKSTGYACVEKTATGFHVHALGAITISKGFKGAKAVQEMIAALQDLPELLPVDKPFLLCAEGQEVYRGRGNADPAGLIMIAQVTGAAAGILRPFAQDLIIPRPREWKQSVPKPIHQARILSKLGWDYKKNQGQAYPTNSPFDLKVSEYFDAVDAAGLAIFGLEHPPTP